MTKAKVFLFSLLFVFLSSFIFIDSADARTRVRGYYRNNGTYVAPHYRSDRNSTKFDNWSTRGNYNPYTGKKGYANPYKSYKYR